MSTRPYEIKNNARRVIVLYGILEDEINEGSIVGINVWSEALLDCMAHIVMDNARLFKGRELEDEINEGSIVGINVWSEALLDCMAHIVMDNARLFKGRESS